MRRALPDPAIGDDVLVGRDPLRLVEVREVLAVLERPVLLDRLSPRNRGRAGDVAGPLGGLAQTGRGDDLAVELGRAADVDEDELRVAEPRQDVVAEGAKAEVGLRELIAGSREGRYVGRQRQAVVEPVLAPAVEDPDVVVTEQLQLPVRPGGEPVVVVAVEDDRRVRADAGLREELREVLAAGDVAADPVGQLAGPVPADGAGQVALLVGGRVDVDLDEADVRIVEVLLSPNRRRRGYRWRIRERSSWRLLSVSKFMWLNGVAICCGSTG